MDLSPFNKSGGSLGAIGGQIVSRDKKLLFSHYFAKECFIGTVLFSNKAFFILEPFF